MSNLEVKEINENDWELYKSLRLASLQESPDSFGSTLKREAAFSDEMWKARLKETTGSASILPLLGYCEGKAVALAWGVLNKTNSVNIYQMWVSPESRGLGIGRALVARIVSWANSLKVDSLSLFVTTTNYEAISLYNYFGFISEDEVEPLRENSELVVKKMTLNLGALDA